MADTSKSPSKSPVKNPYLKKTMMERQTTIPSSPAAATAQVKVAVPNAICHTITTKTPTKTNPYAKNITPATADAKPSAGAKKETKTIPSDSSADAANASSNEVKTSTLTPEQQAKIRQNKERAMKLRIASLEKQEPRKKARLLAAAGGSTTASASSSQGIIGNNSGECHRCGSTDRQSLCIVWNHEGEIQRERSFRGDVFRWSVSIWYYSCIL